MFRVHITLSHGKQPVRRSLYTDCCDERFLHSYFTLSPSSVLTNVFTVRCGCRRGRSVAPWSIRNVVEMAAVSRPIDLKAAPVVMSKVVDTGTQVSKLPDAAAKTVEAAARTAFVQPKSAISMKTTSGKSVAPKMAPPVAEDEEEEEEEDEEEDDGQTRTSSLAMPSNYVPPQLKVGALPISFAATVKQDVGKKSLFKMGGPMKVKKKKKKKKAAGLKGMMLGEGAKASMVGGKADTVGIMGKDVEVQLVDLSVNPGEREKLEKGRGKRKRGIKDVVGSAVQWWTPAKRRAGCIGTGIALLLVTAIVLSVTLATSGPEQTNVTTTPYKITTANSTRSNESSQWNLAL